MKDTFKKGTDQFAGRVLQIGRICRDGKNKHLRSTKEIQQKKTKHEEYSGTGDLTIVSVG